jgi:hypothetical protein
MHQKTPSDIDVGHVSVSRDVIEANALHVYRNDFQVNIFPNFLDFDSLSPKLSQS